MITPPVRAYIRTSTQMKYNPNNSLIRTGRSLLIIMPLFIQFTSCKTTPNKTPPVPTDTIQSISNKSAAINKCFMRISGKQKRDTLKINLQIVRGSLAGEMTNDIFEKDIRRGKLRGKINGKEISAVWTFIQEGIIDSVSVNFRFNNGNLLLEAKGIDYSPEADNRSGNHWIDIPASACASVENKEFAVSGTVTGLMMGKDGYTATLRTENSESYQILLSRNRLRENYITLNKGDHVIVSGDTIHLGENIQVLVKKIQKKNQEKAVSGLNLK
jgi:translation initiation factor IF-1